MTCLVEANYTLFRSVQFKLYLNGDHLNTPHIPFLQQQKDNTTYFVQIPTGSKGGITYVNSYVNVVYEFLINIDI